MIKSIKIQDFIIIDELNLEFDKGFNVITGETGAGKSIIINAIDLTFGARASKDMIRTNAQKAVIETTLMLKESLPEDFVEKFGVENFGNELVIAREITESGSRSRVNGALVTQDAIKILKEKYIDIHSQHQTYTYIQPKHHIELLDSYGDVEHNQIFEQYKIAFAQFNQTQKRLDEAKAKTQLSEQQIDFLKFQIDEIESANVEDIEEDKKLEEELNILSNSEKLKEYTYSAYWSLYGDDGCITDALGKVKTNITKASEMDTNLSDYEAEIITVQESLKELASNLRNYAENMELDEQRLNDIQSRIDVLDKIKRKYGNTLESVTESYEKFKQEYDSIEFSQDMIDELEIEKQNNYKLMSEKAELLSKSRLKLSDTLSDKIRLELEKLDMPKVKFTINVDSCDFNANGKDNVEFFISTNISEDVKPLAKIASGGEISRVMLAIKTIFANTDKIDTIIFDEIDTGISGNACQAVAAEISDLAKSHQIISITHQPIIAAKSDCHFYVAKTQDSKTNVKVYTLDEQNKIKAIAMLAAGEINDESVKFAKQLIYN